LKSCNKVEGIGLRAKPKRPEAKQLTRSITQDLEATPRIYQKIYSILHLARGSLAKSSIAIRGKANLRKN